jgi:hypothetical protein
MASYPLDLSRNIIGQADVGAHPRQNDIVLIVAATTGEDNVVITTSGNPRTVMFVSTVAWFYGTTPGAASTAMIPVAANSPLTLQFPANKTIYVRAASSANLFALLIQ